MGTQATPKRSALMEVQNAGTPRTPTFGRHILPRQESLIISPLSSPISPTANLKLLTKVAAVLSTKQQPQQIVAMYDGSCATENAPEEKYSRRLRSLSFICNKFLELYRLDIPQGRSETISLVGLANRLGIKKRRVYDIINVVASLNLAVKVCKDKYNWFGAQNLQASLANLKTYAVRNDFHVQLRNLLETQPELNWTLGKVGRESLTGADGGNQFLVVKEAGFCAPFDHNRIGLLCQKFIMLCLVSDGMSLSLMLLSKMILSSDIQYKTGVRRLYDVANALEALGLIAKSTDPSARRPSFVYKGPKVDSNCLSAEVYVDCVSENSIDTADSEVDYSQDTSISNLVEIECDDTLTTSDNNNDILCHDLDDGPAAKKRLVFASADETSGPLETKTTVCPVARCRNLAEPPGQNSERIPPSAPAKAISLSSVSSRLLSDEEAAFYRRKLNTAQCSQPTFYVVRSANKITLRLK